MATKEAPWEQEETVESDRDSYYRQKAERNAEMVEYMMVVGTASVDLVFFAVFKELWQSETIWVKALSLCALGSALMLAFVMVYQVLNLVRKKGADQ